MTASYRVMQVYGRLLGFAKRYWLAFLFGLLGTLFLSGFDALFTWMIKPIINHGFVDQNTSFIRWLPLGIMAIFVCRSTAGFFSSYFIARVARYVVMDFRQAIFNKLIRLPITFYDQSSSGQLLSVVIYNVEQLAQASSTTLLSCLRECSLAVGLLVVMFVNSWQLTLIFLLISPVISLFLRWSNRRLRAISAEVQDSVGAVTQIADEAIRGTQVVRLCNALDLETAKFQCATENNRHQELKLSVINSLGTGIVQLLIAIPIALSLFFATLPSLHISAGSFAAMIAAMIGLLRPVRRITVINSDIQRGVAAAASIFEMLDETLESDQGTVPLASAQGKIVFESVSFAYPTDSTPVLKGIDLTIEAGQTVALVGHSGAGKSTLIQLLTRFYAPSSGQIYIDDVPIDHYVLHDVRQQLALVSQQTFLFNGTVAENIAYGLPDASLADIRDAARAAYADHFIMNLSDGYGSKIGDDGVLLSGGQRQRIAIARAILKAAPILILDEATSALDTASEKKIQAALADLMASRTTVVIAHRLSTIEQADHIVVMDQGRIVEQGTHAELLAKAGTYAHLYHTQFNH
jgi:subfamily B ATP-binding cassette protein MsbA